MARPVHEHPIYRISALARPVDPQVRSNRAILIVMALVAVAGGAWGWLWGHGVEAALAAAATAVLVAFLSWALGRELDPDADATAFLAVALALAGWLWLGAPGLWFLAAALVGTRVVNRTVGPPARLSDAIVVLGLLAMAVWLAGHWTVTIVGALAFALDASLPRPRRVHWAFAGLCLAVLAVAWRWGEVTLGTVAWPWALGALTLASVIAIVTTRRLRSSCDLPGHVLEGRRVRAGMAVALVTALLAQLETDHGLVAVPLLATLVAMVIGRVLPGR